LQWCGETHSAGQHRLADSHWIGSLGFLHCPCCKPLRFLTLARLATTSGLLPRVGGKAMGLGSKGKKKGGLLPPPGCGTAGASNSHQEPVEWINHAHREGVNWGKAKPEGDGLAFQFHPPAFTTLPSRPHGHSHSEVARYGVESNP